MKNQAYRGAQFEVVLAAWLNIEDGLLTISPCLEALFTARSNRPSNRPSHEDISK